MKLAMLTLALSVVSAPATAGSSNHFIVACSLYSREVSGDGGNAKPHLKPHNLDLLIDGDISEGGFYPVLDTIDPDQVSVIGKFTKAFFEDSRFAALTGNVRDADTRMLALVPRGSSEYSAMLSDVGKKQEALNGRCWMLKSANADEEFEKLKVEEASQ